MLWTGFESFSCTESPAASYIYVRGDGRLNNNTNRTNQSTISCSSTFRLSLVSFFSFFASSSCWRATDPRGSRGERIDLEQPIAAASPDGVPPGQTGLRVYKSICLLCCVSRCRSDLLRRELRCITPGVEGTRDVFVCEQHQLQGVINTTSNLLVPILDLETRIGYKR